jgi:hypothetical protein
MLRRCIDLRKYVVCWLAASFRRRPPSPWHYLLLMLLSIGHQCSEDEISGIWIGEFSTSENTTSQPSKILVVEAPLLESIFDILRSELYPCSSDKQMQLLKVDPEMVGLCCRRRDRNGLLTS